MGITIALPGALLPFAGGAARVTLEDRPGTVGDALGSLATRHAGVVDRVLDEQGQVRRHVNVFVDGDNIRFMDGLRTPVGRDSTIMIVAAVSGG